MRELEQKLLELKDTSELMIDLAYSSLLYNNRDIAEEVLFLGEMLDELTDEIQEDAINNVLEDGNVIKSLVVVRMAYSMEEISIAAAQIADVVLRGLPPHPVIHLSMRDSEVIITTASLDERSDLVGKTLGQTRLSSLCGMFVIAIKRDRKYIYGPNKSTKMAAGDILIARGPEDGEEFFKDLAMGKESLAED
jgi:uncharacterized protein with PhoU and TrkA domain